MTNNLKFREANQEDLKFLFDLANDEICRASAFESKEIIFEEHIKWFDTKLKNKDETRIFIVFDNKNNQIGQIRFDKIDNNGYIDFSIGSKYRGQGLGKNILSKGSDKIIEEWKDISFIVGEVKSENISSQKSFLNAGFSEIKCGNSFSFIKINPDVYLEKFSVDNVLYGITLLRNEDRITKEIFLDLYYDCFGRREHLDENWYEWFYNKNPWGKCNNYGLFDIEKNKLIGAFGYSCVKYCIDGKEMEGKLGVNGMVSKYYAGKRLYSKLIEFTSKLESRKCDILFSFPHCNNLPSSKGHINAGWKLLQRNFFYSKDTNQNNEGNEKTEAEIFDLKEIRLGIEINKGFNFLRTNEWLNWRFEDRPHKQYSYLKIKNKDSDSYMVLGYYEGKGKKRCQVLDFRANNMTDFSDLLMSVENIALKKKCGILDLMISDTSTYMEIIKNNNFKKTEEYYELLTYSSSKLNLKIEPLLGDFDCV